MKNYNRKEIDNFGNIYYYLDDKLHRTDGPAIEEVSGTKVWYLNNKCHRIDGPSCEFANGLKSWYYYGKYIDVESQEKFKKYIKALILK